MQSLVERVDRWKAPFFWLRFFYPKAVGSSNTYLLYYLFPQKILRINGRIGWPVHFTSRVLNATKIRVGNRSAPGSSSHCYVQGRNGIIIGHNLRMGPGAGLVSANYSVDDYDQWPETPPIRIGDNVWIGMNAVVLPGIAIGENVVIAAGSVVTQDIPSHSVAAGNPCHVIKSKKP